MAKRSSLSFDKIKLKIEIAFIAYALFFIFLFVLISLRLEVLLLPPTGRLSLLSGPCLTEVSQTEEKNIVRRTNPQVLRTVS